MDFDRRSGDSVKLMTVFKRLTVGSSLLTRVWRQGHVRHVEAICVWFSCSLPALLADGGRVLVCLAERGRGKRVQNCRIAARRVREGRHPGRFESREAGWRCGGMSVEAYGRLGAD